MQCLQDNGSGNYSLAAPQPVDYTTCTYVLAQPLDLSSIDKLTAAEGVQLSVAIGTVWAVGATFRIIASFLKSKEVNENE